jgi:ubiquinone/menaquinone biosynthesis C-methylase UbiE
VTASSLSIDQPASAATLHARAREAWGAGDTTGAFELLRRAVAASVDLELLNDFGVAALDAVGAPTARAILAAALAIDPERRDAADNLAILTDWRASETLGGPNAELPERAFPGMPHGKVMADHARRYSFALDVVQGRNVLDLGCGTGYGSEMLTWTATSVRGFDLWQPDVHEVPVWPGGAELTWGHDLCRDALPAADAAIAFEVLEHLADAPAALRLAWQAAPLLVVSFPNPTYHGSHHNPYHVNDWSLDVVEQELRSAAAVRFGQVELAHYRQDGTGAILPGRDPQASYWLIVARGSEAPAVVAAPGRTSVTLTTQERVHLTTWPERAAQDPSRHASTPDAVELLSLHIPKAAGNAFAAVLKEVYGLDSIAFDQGDLDPRRIRSDRWPADCWPRVVTGHFELATWEPVCRKATVVTWLRDPVARVLSWYHFWKSQGPKGDPWRDAVQDGRVSLEEFVRMDGARDAMSALLRGYTLEDLEFVGVQEHFAADLDELSARMGWPRFDVPRLNATQGDEYARFRPTEALVREIRALNPGDEELYRKALELRGRRSAKPVATKSPAELRVDEMKSAWDERARENAMHYIASGKEQWDEAEFSASGLANVRNYVIEDADAICGGRDPKSMRALEIGCGIGRMSEHLAGFFGSLTGVDVSGEMIRGATERLGHLPNATFVETDGASLPFADASFDFVFSFIVFQHVPTKEAVIGTLRDAYRVLAPGGLCKFQVQGSQNEHYLAAKKDTWLGVTFSEAEMAAVAAELGFQPLRSEGADSQYYWHWWRKP